MLLPQNDLEPGQLAQLVLNYRGNLLLELVHTGVLSVEPGVEAHHLVGDIRRIDLILTVGDGTTDILDALCIHHRQCGNGVLQLLQARRGIGQADRIGGRGCPRLLLSRTLLGSGNLDLGTLRRAR